MLMRLLFISFWLKIVHCYCPQLKRDEQFNRLNKHTLDQLNSNCRDVVENEYIFAGMKCFDQAGLVTKWYCAIKCKEECNSARMSVLACGVQCGANTSATIFTCRCPFCDSSTEDAREIGYQFESNCTLAETTLRAQTSTAALTKQSSKTTIRKAESSIESSGIRRESSTTSVTEMTKQKYKSTEESSSSTLITKTTAKVTKGNTARIPAFSKKLSTAKSTEVTKRRTDIKTGNSAVTKYSKMTTIGHVALLYIAMYV